MSAVRAARSMRRAASAGLDRHQTQLYPSQTKILERLTKDEIRIFEALFKGVSTRFGLLAIEKSIENPDVNPSKIFVWGA